MKQGVVNDKCVLENSQLLVHKSALFIPTITDCISSIIGGLVSLPDLYLFGSVWKPQKLLI